ncbi:MAG: hypothetical protein KAI81_09260 [Candidatus Marinimicrobia bacterium]|nr:hypothetical protein [Candidatus Neomarinimicrobiota bacterium]
MNTISKIIALLTIFLFFHACGIYGTKPGSIPPHIKNIHIPMVENETAEFALNETVNSNVINTIIDENILKLADENIAHSILYLSCTNINDKPYTFDETETVKEYKLTLTMSYRWVDTAKKEDVMKGNLSQWAVYYSDSYNNMLSPDDQIDRETAKIELAEKIAEDVVFQLVSDW